MTDCNIEGLKNEKGNVWIKVKKKEALHNNLRQNRVNTYAVRITMLIADIEDDIMDPVMQCTTLPSHSGFSQQKLVSFVTEIHTTSIDFLTPIHKLLTRVLRIILVIVPEHPSDTYVLTMKMEILLEPASNKLLVVYQGRLLASFQDDAKYEHVGQDTRSQGGKDDSEKGKDLKISDAKTEVKRQYKG
ncbi:hypothetical protein Tco_1474789 [Tanacetum coccineum]